MIIKGFNKIVFNQSSFEKLLTWLDGDREMAGQRYEAIRLRLNKKFFGWGCAYAEELADETIDRVIKKIDFLRENYEGDPTPYFYAVAKKVFVEFIRKPATQELPLNLAHKQFDTEKLENLDQCLSKCLKQLSADQRRLILNYYSKDSQMKLRQRRQMTEDLRITPENLRVRAHRIRHKLQKSFLTMEIC